MLTNQLKMFVKADKFNVSLSLLYVFFIYLMSHVSDLTCLST